MNNVMQGLRYEAYDALEGVRSSHLNALRRSPAHFVAKREKPKESTDAMEFGRLFHFAMENRERFMDMVKVQPQFWGVIRSGPRKGEKTNSLNSKDVQDQIENWKMNLPPDSLVVSQEDCDNLIGMLRAVSEHRKLNDMVSGGMREVSVVSQDPETGLKIKCRPDLITRFGHVLDYKTTRDAGFWHMRREIYGHEDPDRPFYALTASHYSHTTKLEGLTNGEGFIICAIEKVPPWGICLYSLDRGQMDVGEGARRQLMRLYSNCLAKDHWPSYDENVVPAHFPDRMDYTRYGDGDLS